MKKILFLAFIIFFPGQNLFSQCTGKWLGEICKLHRVNQNVLTGVALGGRKFQVEKTFKGSLKGIIELDIQLEKGKSYLIFPRPDRKGKKGFKIVCSNHFKLEKAGYKLKFLKDRERTKGQNRIYGFIKEEHKGNKPISTKINIIGNKRTFQTFSDTNGFFEIYGLPRGKYTISPELAPNQRLFDVNSFEEKGKRIEIYGDSDFCKKINLTIKPNNIIGGKVYVSNGEILKTPEVLNLEVESIQKNKKLYPHNYVINKENSFEIFGLPKGKYKLVMNPGRFKEMYGNNKRIFPKLYYPGTLDSEKAYIFSVDDLSKYRDLEFRLPDDYPLKLVSGHVYFSDGQPAARVFVRFYEKTKVLQAYTITNYKGYFQLLLKRGSRGKLESTFILNSQDKSKCNLDTNLGEFIRNYNEYRFYSESKNFKIDFDLNNQNLTFQIEKCEKLSQ